MPPDADTAKHTPRRVPYHILVAIILFAATLAFRLPDRVLTVFDWDNVQYLLSLTRFDPLAHQPHPPAHPLYVLLGWILSGIVGDRLLGLTLANLLPFALGTSMVYFLGRSLYDDATGIAAAMIYMVSPLAGYFASFPNSFPTEGMLAAVLWLILVDWIRDPAPNQPPKHLSLMILPWVFGFLSGFRPSFVAFALPAVLYVVLTGRPRVFPILLVHGLIAAALWLVPLIILSGGWDRYMLALDAEADPFLRPLSGVNILGNLSMFYRFAEGLLGDFAMISVLYSLIAGIRIAFARPASGIEPFQKHIAILALIWVAPILAFHILSYTHPGFLVYYLPLATLALARFCIWVGKLAAPRSDAVAQAVGVALAIVAVLVLVHGWSTGSGQYFSRPTLREQQQRVSAFCDDIQENFPLEKTAIVTWEHFRQAGWYLPEAYSVYPQGAYCTEHGIDPERGNIYLMHNHKTTPRAWHIKRDGPIPPLILPGEVEYVVVSAGTYAHLANPEGFSEQETSAGETYYWKRAQVPVAVAIEGERWVLGTAGSSLGEPPGV